MLTHIHNLHRLKPFDHNMLPPEPKPSDADLYDWVWQSPSPTLELAQSPLFKLPARFLTLDERTRLTYERAKAICDAYSTAPIFLSSHLIPAKKD